MNVLASGNREGAATVGEFSGVDGCLEVNFADLRRGAKVPRADSPRREIGTSGYCPGGIERDLCVDQTAPLWPEKVRQLLWYPLISSTEKDSDPVTQPAAEHGVAVYIPLCASPSSTC